MLLVLVPARMRRPMSAGRICQMLLRQDAKRREVVAGSDGWPGGGKHAVRSGNLARSCPRLIGPSRGLRNERRVRIRRQAVTGQITFPYWPFPCSWPRSPGRSGHKSACERRRRSSRNRARRLRTSGHRRRTAGHAAATAEAWNWPSSGRAPHSREAKRCATPRYEPNCPARCSIAQFPGTCGAMRHS